MHKFVIHKPGSYDQISLEKGAIPQPIKGEALIEVSYFGINYAGINKNILIYE